MKKKDKNKGNYFFFVFQIGHMTPIFSSMYNAVIIALFLDIK